MKTIIVTSILLLGALALVPTTTAAPGNGNSWFGLCNAWNHNENGRENGNAENSTAFKQLQQQAEDAGHESVEEFCATVPHPGNPGGNGNGNGRPDDAPRGPPF